MHNVNKDNLNTQSLFPHLYLLVVLLPLKAALNGGSGFNGSPRDFLAAGR